MKNLTPSVLIVALLAAMLSVLPVQSARADKVIMKNGTTYEGRILKQNSTMVTFEVDDGFSRKRKLLLRSQIASIKVEEMSSSGSSSDDRPRFDDRDDRRGDEGGSIIDRAKAATALIDLGIGSGSGFCVSPDGQFVTNHHVVEGLRVGDEVDVVLYPGEYNQTLYKGKVLRKSTQYDLALIKVKDDKPFDSIRLGDDRRLRETDSVTALGFPFGRMLSTDAEGYPNISVNTGKVSSLRKARGLLEAIQIDAAVNPGNSGGPVINDRGEVVGVVVSGIPGSGVNFAVPVSHLTDFLDQPSLVVTTSDIPYRDRYKEVEFSVDVVQGKRQMTLTNANLTLISPGGEERVVRLSRRGDGFTAVATPLEATDDAQVIRLRAKRGDDTYTTEVNDRPIAIGNKKIQLSEVYQVVSRGDMAIVTTIDGIKYAGRLIGMNDLRDDRGHSLDPMKVDSVSVLAHGIDAYEIPYEIEATGRDGKPVFVQGVITLTNAPALVLEVRRDVMNADLEVDEALQSIIDAIEGMPDRDGDDADDRDRDRRDDRDDRDDWRDRDDSTQRGGNSRDEQAALPPIDDGEKNLAPHAKVKASAQARGDGSIAAINDKNTSTDKGQYWFAGSRNPEDDSVTLVFDNVATISQVRLLVPKGPAKFSDGREPLDYALDIVYGRTRQRLASVRNGQHPKTYAVPGDRDAQWVVIDLARRPRTRTITLTVTATSGVSAAVYEMEVIGSMD